MKSSHIAKMGLIYVRAQSDNAPLGILSTFLTNDVVNDENSFKEWIYSDREDTGSNASWLSKFDNDEIHISNILAEGTHYPVFVTTKKQLLSIIEQWVNLYKQQPDEIIISQHDDGNISLKGIFDSPCHTYGKQN